MEINKLRRDSSKIEGGDWVDNIPGMGDLRLKVRGSNSRIVRKALSKKVFGLDGPIPEEGLPDDVSDRIDAEVSAESVLLDWDGLTQDGKPFPYDPEVAKAWLADLDFDDFKRAVDYAANVVAKRRKEAEESIAKNSAKSSAGS